MSSGDGMHCPRWQGCVSYCVIDEQSMAAGMPPALDRSQMTWHFRVARTNSSCGALHQGHCLAGKPVIGLDVCGVHFIISISRPVTNDAAGAQHVVVMDGAYHGHTTATIDLSPYKFNGAGGTGRWVPSWTVAKYSIS